MAIKNLKLKNLKIEIESSVIPKVCKLLKCVYGNIFYIQHGRGRPNVPFYGNAINLRFTELMAPILVHFKLIIPWFWMLIT